MRRAEKISQENPKKSSRGVYEAPGMTLLYFAHQCLEQVTLDVAILLATDKAEGLGSVPLDTQKYLDPYYRSAT